MKPSKYLNIKQIKMKKLFTLLALTITFSMNAQMTDNSSGTSATGDYSVAMGSDTTASGYASTAMGNTTYATASNSTAMGIATEASGTGSTAMGWQTKAIGARSTAIGYKSEAQGVNSIAMGYLTIASGEQSTAMGAYSEASEYSSVAMGENTTASGENSTAMGEASQAIGENSTAMGDATQAIGENSTAMGLTTIASGYVATAIGRSSTAIGTASAAMGVSTTASDYGSLVIGQYNSAGSSVTTDQQSLMFNTQNTAFVIGNGTENNRSDAFMVMFNGDATLAGNLSVNSDARLKSNIISLGSTMSKLLEIDGKSYIMKRDENKEQKIGLLAQDIEKVFPELVSESNGIKSVNYQGLVPVLINALKEQDVKMKEQQMEIESLRDQEKRIDRLEKLVAQLD